MLSTQPKCGGWLASPGSVEFGERKNGRREWRSGWSRGGRGREGMQLPSCRPALACLRSSPATRSRRPLRDTAKSIPIEFYLLFWPRWLEYIISPDVTTLDELPWRRVRWNEALLSERHPNTLLGISDHATPHCTLYQEQLPISTTCASFL